MTYPDKKPRHLSEILLIQIVATYLVILGHSYPFVTPLPYWLTRTQIFIYCFHMPLFVWISGYLLVYTQQALRNSTRAFAKKRFFKLLVPYFVLSLVAIVPKYFIQPLLNDSVSLDADSVIRTFLVPRENVWGHFWFLPMIFLLGLGGIVIDRLIKTHKPKPGWLLILAVFFVLYCIGFKKRICPWFSIDDIICFGWIYVSGILSAYYKIIEKIKTRIIRAVAAFGVAVIIFLCNDVTSIPLYLTNAIIAVLMIYSLIVICRYFSAKIKINRDAVYAQTFTIFLLSWPCQAVVNVVVERVLHGPYYIIMPSQFLVGLGAPMLLIFLINKIETRYDIHWISFCLGR